MRFSPEAEHGGNAGLHVARERLEEVKKKYPYISYGDLWTLAGICALQEMVSWTSLCRAGQTLDTLDLN